MHKNLLLIFLILIGFCESIAQDEFTYQTKSFQIPLLQSGAYGENVSEIIQFNDGWKAPEPGGNYEAAKSKVNKLRENYYLKLHKSDGYISTPKEISPSIDTTFNGQATGGSGIPCDNHIAISNGGKIVSVQNSSLRVLDENGKSLLFKTLYSFANGKIAGLTNYCYDPKVVYDPIADRFILFFLHESKVATNFGILAFSKTNDPAGEWNFYKIPGNALKNDKWSDYPIMAISKEDVFISLNLLTENTDWRVGFNQSIIWQINKSSGYMGDSLKQKVYFDIRYKNKAIWSICPVQGGFVPTHPNMYFLSVRPGDLENDTLFVHEISNTLESKNAQLSLKILQTNKTYGVPPVAPQPKGGDTLQTNDTRVLGGIYHNGKIQYVQTTVIKPYYRSGVFHGMFKVNSTNKVSVTHITSDSVDYAYPSIAYAGKGSPSDQSSVITFSHVSSKSFPGTSAIFHTQVANLPSLFSEVVRVKNGLKTIERLPVQQVAHERWGDYTGIQYKYNEPGTIWLVGTYGNDNRINGTWIGKLKVTDKIEIASDIPLKIFPNPIKTQTSIGINLTNTEEITIELCNEAGQIIKEILKKEMPEGYNEIYFSSDDLAHGIYYIYVKGPNNKIKFTSKLIK
jgi:hypothetical protein